MRRWLAGRRYLTGRSFLTARSGDMVEGALTFPLMALVTLALVNLALAGFSTTTANHAAGYGARAPARSPRWIRPAGRWRPRSRRCKAGSATTPSAWLPTPIPAASCASRWTGQSRTSTAV